MEAKCLLRMALERCTPSGRVSLRVALPTPTASLSELLRQKAQLPPDSPLARVCQQLALEEPAAPRRACVVEVHAAFPPSPQQSANLAAFAAAAAAHEITSVLFAPSPEGLAGATPEAALSGFERLCLPGARLAAREFVERVRLWLVAATANRWQVSADGLRLLRHCCTEQGHFWPQLTQDSLLISAAARLPLVTSWAVQLAQARAVPLQDVSDVPVEWRAAPRRWPSLQMSALLSELRSAEQASPAVS